MAILSKIDSNVTSLAYAEEETLGVLPVTPVWKPLEPNSYDDFGGENTLLARQTINAGRQRKKGVITDLDASGGFEQDFTQTNFQDLLQGLMYASFRRKAEREGAAAITDVEVTGNLISLPDTDGFYVGSLIWCSGFAVSANNGLKRVAAVISDTTIETDETLADETPGSTAKIVVVGHEFGAGDLDVSATGNYTSLTSTTKTLTELGLIPGEWIFIGGDIAGDRFATAVNNGFKRVRSIAANTIVVDKSLTTMATEASTTETVRVFYGRVLKNEALLANQLRRSYNLERQLGAPDTSNPSQIQSEYLVGAVPNEFELQINTADKVMGMMSFVALYNQQRTGATGVKSGTRQAANETDAFNTSSDFASIRMSIHSESAENPDALFAYLTDLTITFNNNLTANKAVSVLGAFEVTAGTFEVGGEVTAYFSEVDAINAVTDNSDVTIHAVVVKNNAGFALDLPLIALGDGRLEIALNDPITIPLEMQAATAAKIDTNLDHTALWVFWDYLPDLATPA